MRVNKELSKGSHELIILKLLSRQDMYGYQIIKELEIRSERVFTLKEGTLYPCLHRLEEQGLIESSWQLAGAKPRKYYSITRKGIAAMEEKVREAKEFVGALHLLLGAAN